MTLPTREEISPDCRMMRQCIQTDATHYVTANYKRVRGPWGNGTVWQLVGSRVLHDGIALAWVEPVAAAVQVAEVSAEAADATGEEPWRRQAREDDEWYWRRKTLRGET
jgi:hypothetical protein